MKKQTSKQTKATSDLETRKSKKKKPTETEKKKATESTRQSASRRCGRGSSKRVRLVGVPAIEVGASRGVGTCRGPDGSLDFVKTISAGGVTPTRGAGQAKVSPQDQNADC